MGQEQADRRLKGSPAFRDWLLEQMRRREWTQADLVRHSGFDAGLISRWVQMERKPTPESLERLADALGADLDELLVLNGHRRREAGDDDPQVTALVAKLKQVKWSPDRYRILEVILEDMRRRAPEEVAPSVPTPQSSE